MGDVYIQHLAVLRERHERRMACLLKLNNQKKCFHSTRMPPPNRTLMPKGGTLLSKIKILISKSFDQIYIFLVTRIDLMLTKIVFYVVKGFGLIKRGMRVKRKRFFKQSNLPQKEKTYLSSGIYKFPAVMLVLSETFHVFESRIACIGNIFQGELLCLFGISSHKVFREENHPFRRNAWTFMKFIPGLHTTWHMCVFHDQ